MGPIVRLVPTRFEPRACASRARSISHPRARAVIRRRCDPEVDTPTPPLSPKEWTAADGEIFVRSEAPQYHTTALPEAAMTRLLAQAAQQQSEAEEHP